MVFIKFVGFILSLLLVSFALQSLSVHGHVLHQERRLLEGNSIKQTQENDASLKKEYVAEALGIDSGSNEVRIGGRKMAMTLKEDGGMASRSSTDMNASKKGPQDLLNNQGQETTLETTISPSQSSLKQGFSRSIASPSSFSTNKMSPDDHQRDEWRKLLDEADKKVMQMMKRDYGGWKKPRRTKPPINNHEPRN